MILLTVGSCVVILLSSVWLFTVALNDAAYTKVDVAATVVAYEINELEAKARIAARGMANNPKLVESLVTNDRNELLEATRSLQTVTQIDFCSILDGEGMTLARTHKPEAHGDNVVYLPHVKEALDGKVSSCITQGLIIRFGVYAGAPIYDSNANRIGIVSLGFRLDNPDLVENLKKRT